MVTVSIRLFFFFQAEDGIRDYKVTGVQTCALPICTHRKCTRQIEMSGQCFSGLSENQDSQPLHLRSEEHTSELQSPCNLVCRLLLEKKKNPTDLVHRPAFFRLADTLRPRICAHLRS